MLWDHFSSTTTLVYIGFIDPLALLFIGRCDPMLHRNSVRHVANPTRRTPCPREVLGSAYEVQCYAKPEDVSSFFVFLLLKFKQVGFHGNIACEREKKKTCCKMCMFCWSQMIQKQTSKWWIIFSFGWTLMKCCCASGKLCWTCTLCLLELPSRQQSHIPPRRENRQIIDSKGLLKRDTVDGRNPAPVGR